MITSSAGHDDHGDDHDDDPDHDNDDDDKDGVVEHRGKEHHTPSVKQPHHHCLGFSRGGRRMMRMMMTMKMTMKTMITLMMLIKMMMKIKRAFLISQSYQYTLSFLLDISKQNNSSLKFD